MAVREVTGIISSSEVIRMTLPPPGYVEVREKMDGSWVVSYSDPGFIPCPPVCHLKHKHEYVQPQIDSHYRPTDFEDATAWAHALADGREVKVVSFIPLHERRKHKSSQEAD